MATSTRSFLFRRLALSGGTLLTALGILACSGSDAASDPTASVSPGKTATAATSQASPTAAAATTTPEPTATAEPEPTATPEAPAPEPTPVQEPTPIPPPPVVPTETPVPPPPPPPPAPSVPTTVTFTADKLQFDLRSVEVPANSPITVVMQNNDTAVPHDVIIVNLGQTGLCTGPCTTSVSFNSGAPGTYNFLCSLHVATMRGTFTVR